MLEDSEDGLSSSAGINGKETADDEVNGNSTGASMMKFVGGCVSSEELFSSATTANDSVIFVSSNSVAQPAHAQNTSVSPSKTSPIDNIECVQEVNAPGDNHPTPLFSLDTHTQPPQAFFYVTEHSEHQNCLSYYRKKVWYRIQELVVRIIPYQQIPLVSIFHTIFTSANVQFVVT